ncbi:hypothetical protein LZ199_20495 [Myxococcus sp. QH3KD-4-1]|nr:hypothetical protein [Myxococcus qinghaiensis]
MSANVGSTLLFLLIPGLMFLPLLGAVIWLAGRAINMARHAGLLGSPPPAPRLQDPPRQHVLWDNQGTLAVGSTFALLIFAPHLLIMNIGLVWGFIIGRVPLSDFLLGAATLLVIDVYLGQMLVLPAGRNVLRKLRFRRTRLLLPGTSLALGTRVPLEWVGPPEVAKLPAVTVTLRRIQERFKTTGHGKARRTRIVRDIKYERTQNVETATLRDTGRLSFTLDLPPSDPRITTELSLPRRLWEMTITARRRSGLDLDVTFCLPVYAVQEMPATSEAPAPGTAWPES